MEILGRGRGLLIFLEVVDRKHAWRWKFRGTDSGFISSFASHQTFWLHDRDVGRGGLKAGLLSFRALVLYSAPEPSDSVH